MSGVLRPRARRRPPGGAPANPPGRFARWVHEPEPGERAPRPAPSVRPERSGEVLQFNRSPDLPFDRTVNPYRGCEHGCVYCYARPSHAYLDLSPGEDFERVLVYKPDAPERLRAALARPGYRPAPIALGMNTDAYQPIERELRLTRRLLELLLAHHHPVTLVTKSTLILRDLDLLEALAERRLVSVAVSLTTLDAALKARLEPLAAGPAQRLAVMQTLAAAGVPVGAMIAPVIPALTDHELERLVAAAAEAGATWAAWTLLRLPHEVAPLFDAWLAEHAPLRRERVLSALRALHGGRLYRAEWGRRMRGSGVYAELLARRFELARRRHGLAAGPPALDCRAFRPPGGRQLTLDL
ncbi:MAG: radical SAM protein [Gammaproteobacteria bacterium]|nr:MAG: radical SAM protein [Gammaproteobacteria bacterium]